MYVVIVLLKCLQEIQAFTLSSSAQNRCVGLLQACAQGYAIGSAAVVSLALFGAYTVRANIVIVDVLDPWTFTGLLIGGMLPYAFSALTMKSVGIAANDMVEECMAQFPHIIDGTMEPQYKRCIEISTKASLHEMIAPGALVIVTPIAAGMAFGKNCTGGLLAGALISGMLLAISMSNSGSAWDNSKKYIEVSAIVLLTQWQNMVRLSNCPATV